MVVEHYHRFPHAYQVSNSHDYRRLSGPESGPEGVVIHTGNALQHSDDSADPELLRNSVLLLPEPLNIKDVTRESKSGESK